jgi:hypothetical protein
VGQEGSGFPRVGSFLHTGQHSLTCGMVAQEQRGRFGNGPLEVSVPEVLACRAQAFARGFFRTRDQATIGDKRLPPWEAITVVDVVEPHEAEALADPRHRLQHLQGVGVMVVGGLDARACAVAKELVIRGDQGPVDCDALVYGSLSTTCSAALTIGCVGELLPEFGQVVLTVGILDRRQQFSPFAQQVGAASSEVAGRVHLRRIDRGWREHATAEQRGNRVGIDRVAFRFAGADGVRRARVPQDASNPLLGAEIGAPIPGEQTLDGHAEPLAVWSNGLEKRLRGGLHMAGQQDFAIMAQAADLHRAGRQVDTPVNGVWLGVESHAVSASCVSERCSQRQHTTAVCGGGGLNHYHRHAGDGEQRPLVPRSRFRRLTAGVRALDEIWANSAHLICRVDSHVRGDSV